MSEFEFQVRQLRNRIEYFFASRLVRLANWLYSSPAPWTTVDNINNFSADFLKSRDGNKTINEFLQEIRIREEAYARAEKLGLGLVAIDEKGNISSADWF